MPTESPIPTAEQVFTDFAPRVYSIARRMLGNDIDAEDVTQDVMLQVVRRLGSFRGDAAVTTWLHRVTVNAALGLRRQRATRRERQSPDGLAAACTDSRPSGPVRHWAAPPDDQAERSETLQLIERAIGRLPAKYRCAFVLADVEGLANAEVGDLLGLSLPAVKSRLHRARLMLRDALAGHLGFDAHMRRRARPVASAC
jgi:RNA polymerase sigma-70 factor (ECF subfamily)